MQETGIEWTATPRADGTMEPGFSANPLKYRDKASGKVVWACVKHSPGCANCYAESLAKRYGRGGPFSKEEMRKVEPFLDEKELRQLLKSPKLTGKRVFVGDMTDVFGDWVPDALLDRLFAVFALRPDVTFQVLTKRADRLRDYVGGNEERLGYRISQHAYRLNGNRVVKAPDWPFKNLWLGVSCENQEAADRRIPLLLQTPAAVRFLSCEPLLGELDLSKWLEKRCNGCGLIAPNPYIAEPVEWDDSNPSNVNVTSDWDDETESHWLNWDDHCGDAVRVSWVIVGGESGSDARPCRVEWIRSIVEQCKAASVPVFCKQVGSNVVTSGGWPHESGDVTRPLTIPDGFGNYSIRLRDRKGGDIEEWPADLQVREFPEVPAHV